MLSLIDRLLLREVLKAFLAVSIILLLILASNEFVRYLAKATAGDIAANVVFTLLGVELLRYLGFLFAPAFFIGVVLSLGRMYRDDEISALRACGIGTARLYRGVFLVVVPLTLIAAYLSFYLMPWSEMRVSELKKQREQVGAVSLLAPGRFNEFRDGRIIFYVETVNEDDGTLGNVFVQTDQGIVTARSGYQDVDEETGSRYLVLVDGFRYLGVAGARDYRFAEFERYGVRIADAEDDEVVDDLDARPTAALLDAQSPRERAELHWRLAVPLSVPALALLAVPLSRNSPRQGRYGRLIMAVLAYLLYSNLLGVGKDMMKDGAVPVGVDLWWVHGLVVMAAVALILRETGLSRLGLFRGTFTIRR